MAWPPAALPTNRTNATPQQNTHPADHNAIALAINDTVVRVLGLTGNEDVGIVTVTTNGNGDATIPLSLAGSTQLISASVTDASGGVMETVAVTVKLLIAISDETALWVRCFDAAGAPIPLNGSITLAYRAQGNYTGS